MPNFMQWGNAWLAQQRKQFAGESVSYERGNCSVTGGITATRGQTSFETEDSEGFVVRAHSIDWLFLASDLVLEGLTLLPEVRDFITDSDGKIYQVLQLPGGAHYKFSDPQQTMLRVHTRFVGDGER